MNRALTAMLLCLFISPAAAQEHVGATTGINPAATRMTPGSISRRTLLMGDQIVFNENIVTQPTGQAIISFLDRSALTIGPDSDVTIDEFVYDPAAGTGKMALNASKGVFRFVGGALSKNNDTVHVKTEATTIGIRGGIVLFDVKDDETTAVLAFGDEMKVTGRDGQSARVFRKNWAVTINRASGAISKPFRAPPELMAQIAERLEPKTTPQDIDDTPVVGIGGQPLGERFRPPAIAPTITMPDRNALHLNDVNGPPLAQSTTPPVLAPAAPPVLAEPSPPPVAAPPIVNVVAPAAPSTSDERPVPPPPQRLPALEPAKTPDTCPPAPPDPKRRYPDRARPSYDFTKREFMPQIDRAKNERAHDERRPGLNRPSIQ